MNPKRRGPVLQRVTLALGAFLVACGLAAVYRSSEAMADPGAGQQIKLDERWPINGSKQGVVIRGRDTKNPILVWVGDLWCETPVLRRYQGDLERDFTVVYWCQRETGNSFDPFARRPSRLTIDEYVSDLDELLRQVRTRLGDRKVVLVSHSSGTVIGLRYVAAHPQSVAAYVGVGQIIDAPESFALSYRWAQETAKLRGVKDATTELDAIGPPPYGDGRINVLRKWVVAFGGAFHQRLSYGRLAWLTATSGLDGWRHVAAIAMTDEEMGGLTNELMAVRFPGKGARYQVPIYFASGRYDRRADPGLAERFLGEISAPRKGSILFEQSAHSPPLEEPEAFRQWLVRTVRPTALAA
jgi:proline iminopeptidase